MESNYYCTNCGEEMNENGEICTSCGVRQGSVKKHCYNCGNKVQSNQEICLNCGVNPKKVKKPNKQGQGTDHQGANINMVLSTIAGYMLPGLPSILWLNQKAKGFVLIGLSIACVLIFPVIGNIILGVFGAVDAYQLSKRVNNGEALSEWMFFWDN